MAEKEQRRAPRKLVALKGSVLREDAKFFQDEVMVQTINLSRTGALVQSATALVAGDICTLTLSRPAGGYGDIPARIVRVERQPDGSYHAGLEFRNLSADEEFLVDSQKSANEK